MRKPLQALDTEKKKKRGNSGKNHALYTYLLLLLLLEQCFFLKIVNVIQTYLGNNNKKKDDVCESYTSLNYWKDFGTVSKSLCFYVENGMKLNSRDEIICKNIQKNTNIEVVSRDRDSLFYL